MAKKKRVQARKARGVPKRQVQSDMAHVIFGIMVECGHKQVDFNEVARQAVKLYDRREASGTGGGV